MSSKKIIWAVIALAILIIVVAGYIYFSKPAKESALGTTEKVSEGVPKISTNPAEEVPEINPLDRANPFKYTNPLR